MRLINADKLEKNEPHYDEEGNRIFYKYEIDEAQTVTVRECKQELPDYIIRAFEKESEWILDNRRKWICANCGAVPSDWKITGSKFTVTAINRYCRYCGAKMIIKKKEG